jgi:hypothetical protein
MQQVQKLSGSSPSSPEGDLSAGTEYSPATHAPRSIILQRSEQNGRWGFPSHSTSFLQIGQATIINNSRKDKKIPDSHLLRRAFSAVPNRLKEL